MAEYGYGACAIAYTTDGDYGQRDGDVTRNQHPTKKYRGRETLNENYVNRA